MIFIRIIAITGLLLVHETAIVHAKPTKIEVRAIAKGGKFIGSSMGGVRIAIRDADTGAVLAEGVTRGSTGNTDTIMGKSGGRWAPRATPDAAGFTASININEPRLLEISALGPLAQRQATVRASVTQWVVPGRHITGGDGVVLELPGFVVDILAPAAHVFYDQPLGEVHIEANVTLMCGCQVTPSGVWDAKAIQVSTLIKRDGRLVGEIPLRYTGTSSRFAGPVPARRSGVYEVVVYAYDPRDGNTGVDAVTFLVQ